MILDEHLKYEANSESLAKAGGRALGSIIKKFKFLKNMGFRTFEKLISTCVIPILGYSSGIWGFKNYHVCEQILHRAIKFFLGVHKFTPIRGLYVEVCWLPQKFDQWTNMVRLWNQLLVMEDYQNKYF